MPQVSGGRVGYASGHTVGTGTWACGGLRQHKKTGLSVDVFALAVKTIKIHKKVNGGLQIRILFFLQFHESFNVFSWTQRGSRYRYCVTIHSLTPPMYLQFHRVPASNAATSASASGASAQRICRERGASNPNPHPHRALMHALCRRSVSSSLACALILQAFGNRVGWCEGSLVMVRVQTCHSPIL